VEQCTETLTPLQQESARSNAMFSYLLGMTPAFDALYRSEIVFPGCQCSFATFKEWCADPTTLEGDKTNQQVIKAMLISRGMLSTDFKNDDERMSRCVRQILGFKILATEFLFLYRNKLNDDERVVFNIILNHYSINYMEYVLLVE
jgi:hypothetical protein